MLENIYLDIVNISLQEKHINAHDKGSFFIKKIIKTWKVCF